MIEDIKLTKEEKDFLKGQLTMIIDNEIDNIDYLLNNQKIDDDNNVDSLRKAWNIFYKLI